MEIEQSSLYREITSIIQSPAKNVHYSWVAQIHVGNNTYPAIKVVSVDIVRDYEGSYSDEIHVEMVVPYGTFFKRIFPYMDALDVTLFKYPLAEQGDTESQNNALESERYTAVVQSPLNSPVIENNGSNNSDEEAMNLQGLLTVKMELINKSIEQLRMISVGGGAFRQVTVEKVIKAVMTKASQGVVIDQNRINKGVEMVKASNQQIRDHIILPQGISLVDVPSYIHEMCGGVYSAGFGYYLQGDHWYVYPCYDPTRLNQGQAVTIINVPKNKFPGVERTYRQDGNNLVIMATGEVKFFDNANSSQLNKGNGVRFADADKFMGGFSVTSDNQTVISRSRNNTEVIGTPRANGLNNIKQSNAKITSNPYVEYSKLARRSGSFLALTWENSNPQLITPGMLVMVLYLDGETVASIYGVVNQAHHMARSAGPGMTNARHVTDTGLSVFVKRPLGDGDTSDLGIIDPT